MKIFSPQIDAMPFRQFAPEAQALKRMTKEYFRLIEIGYDSKAALHAAFVRYHKSAHGVSTELGVEEFFDRFCEALNAAEDHVRTMANMYFAPYSGRLETLEEVSSTTDPRRQIEWVRREPRKPSKRDPRIRERRLYYEARRNLTIALQLMVMEMIERHLLISNAIQRVNELANERVFEADLKHLWVAAELSEGDRRVVGGATDEPAIRLFMNESSWNEFRSRRKKQDRFFAHERQECRVIRTKDACYIVWVRSRRKTQESRLIKLERRGKVTDSAGWRYVVMGVMPVKGGRIRVATREDARSLSEYLKGVLWTDPLRSEDTEKPQNHMTASGYWDVKTAGCILMPRRDEGWFTAVSTEQIVIPVGDHISDLMTTAEENHRLYAGRRALRFIAPEYFGHIPNINWGSKHTRETLEKDWRSRLPSVKNSTS